MPPYAVGRGAVGIAGLPGRIYNPPLQTRLLPFPAVGAHCICAHAAPPGSPGLQSSRPGPGGMWACRPTPLAGGAVGIAGLPGRIYNPPLQTRLLPFPAVGAHCICAHAAPPGSPGLQSSRPGPGGMWACRAPPFGGVRWESRAFSGGHTGRPYGPALGFLVGAGCMHARTGFRFAPGSMVPPGVRARTALGGGEIFFAPPCFFQKIL